VSRRLVVFSSQADADIESIGRWWAANRSAEQAQRWVKGILDTIENFGVNAERHPLAPESERLPVETRQLTFGLGRRPTHRVLYTIRPEGVYIVRVRHVSQDAVGPDDL
jgi:plasmid stabilization system protein ParE